MVGLDRIELSTSRLSGVRSNHLSYRPNLIVWDHTDNTERSCAEEATLVTCLTKILWSKAP